MGTAWDALMGWVRDFITAFIADILVHRDAGKGGGTTSTITKKLGSDLHDHLFPSSDDEAAFELALSGLSPSERDKVTSRLKQIGPATEVDPAERQTFRKVIVTLGDQETRVMVLKAFAELPDGTWQNFLEVTGAARAGNLALAIRLGKKYFGTTLPAWYQTADQEAAKKINAAGVTLDQGNQVMAQKFAGTPFDGIAKLLS